MKYYIYLLIIFITLTSCSEGNSSLRLKENFNSEWRFALIDDVDASNIDFNDTSWNKLNLPHDWSIEGEFNENNPAGIGGGALPGGIGWYRKTFYLPHTDSNKCIYITFDGVYQNSTVYINGKLLGNRPNGYISFQYELTPYLNYGDKENIIAVKVDNSKQPNSRWYSGSGIYRNVWLEKTNHVHVNLWGTHILTPKVTEELAEVNIKINIRNNTGSNKFLEVETIIKNQSNKSVARLSTSITVKSNSINEISQLITVNSPVLWSIENPYLYKAVNFIKENGKTVDIYETTFGIRYFSFHSQKGFFLNGKPVKIKGVCNHHDQGALGSAINIRAKERQLEILKEMGCNAIRTSHNPVSSELLDLCDRMGFIVMNETFDMWKKKKTEFDYAQYWDKWHKIDLKDHLLRDRNHPCIFMWSIGNEILEQWDKSGIKIANELSAIVKKYAPNIPITSACNDPKPENYIIKSGALSIIGYNYKHNLYSSFPETFENQVFIASETTSSLASRGVYNMPSDSIRRWPYKWDEPFHDGNKDNTCSSYDNCSAPWGSTHEESWSMIKKYSFLSGMFIWTGFDYLGEPTPYQWPSRSSYFGIIDLAGFPKDAYYFYQSEWTDKDVLHIFPHWNWNKGDNIDIWAYTNCTEVDLYLNEQHLGKRFNSDTVFHLSWNVDFCPGILKAIGKTHNGKIIEKIIHTAGEPYQIKMEADRSIISGDNNDISFISVSILDEKGVFVPYADNEIEFQIIGDAKILATDNGCQTDITSFQSNKRKAFKGKCIAIVTAEKSGKNATVIAKSKGLIESKIALVFVE